MTLHHLNLFKQNCNVGQSLLQLVRSSCKNILSYVLFLHILRSFKHLDDLVIEVRPDPPSEVILILVIELWLLLAHNPFLWRHVFESSEDRWIGFVKFRLQPVDEGEECLVRHEEREVPGPLDWVDGLEYFLVFIVAAWLKVLSEVWLQTGQLFCLDWFWFLIQLYQNPQGFQNPGCLGYGYFGLLLMAVNKYIV